MPLDRLFGGGRSVDRTHRHDRGGVRGLQDRFGKVSCWGSFVYDLEHRLGQQFAGLENTADTSDGHLSAGQAEFVYYSSRSKA